MKLDNHNLKCALLGFLFAAFVGFAFSGGLAESSLARCNCPAPAVQAHPAK